MKRSFLLPAVALATALSSGCRDTVPPFTPEQREYPPPVYAVTYGYGNDADPRWSADGDTVLYHTSRLGVLPIARGVLAGIPRTGGVATPVLADIQSTIGRRLVTPAYSPDGGHIAFVDLLGVDGLCSVPAPGVPMNPCMRVQPLLDSAVLRVRRVGEVRNVALDPRITIRFQGTDPGYRMATDGPWFERLFPFQARHRAEDLYVFRPSWAPDGQRIAYSDGLAIHVWRVGDDTTTVVPGTVDGVSAAWSPDGQWIAFTALMRTDSTVINCACPGDVVAVRRTYSTQATLVITRPDGSESIELGEGEEPAWSPDGSAVYARRDGRVVRVPINGGSVTVVPHTERARAPAVSPNGEWLAFSRTKTVDDLDYDIWIVSLEP